MLYLCVCLVNELSIVLIVFFNIDLVGWVLFELFGIFVFIVCFFWVVVMLMIKKWGLYGNYRFFWLEDEFLVCMFMLLLFFYDCVLFSF